MPTPLVGLAKKAVQKAVKRNPDGSAKKPGKPKPTAGKGIYKNIITTGGKTGRAIENKMRSESKLPKLQTTGKIKANARNAKVKEFVTPTAKGKNKNWAKETNKKTLPTSTTSRRATLKEVKIISSLEKHPLVRNAGNASSEAKYRVMRGRPVPVKKKGK
jgi:hypothetical protein